jgi:adenylate kinase family enzyme
MRLRQLFEASNNEVAIIFGRFNPPHMGHKAAWELASKSPVWFVGTNQSTVGPKDPLPYDVKVKAMKAVWPEVESHIVAETSWLTMASKVYEQYPKATLLCLTDEDWVTKTIKDYNGKEGPHGYYNFAEIKQKPTPRLSSATALRDAVMKGDRDAFSKAAGVDADTLVDGKPFFDLVAEYLLPYADVLDKIKTRDADLAKKKKKAVAKPSEGVAEGLEEGVNDPHTFKCIFLFGPMGAGKSTVARPLLTHTGLRSVNLDNFNELFVKKGQVPTGHLSPDQLEKSWQLTQKQQQNFIDGRLGVIIDGSGRNPSTAIGVIEKLAPLGYEFMMIFVNVSEATSIARQQSRAEKQKQQWGAGRQVDPELAKNTYAQVQKNLDRYSAYFGPQRFVYVDNENTPDLTQATKKVEAFLRAPVRQPEALAWIQSQKGGDKVAQQQNKLATAQDRQQQARKQFNPLNPKFAKKGMGEGSLNEFAPGSGDGEDGPGDDPYKYPKPESYRRSIDYFGRFEADHFDREDFDDDTGVFKGYWGSTQIAYFKFDNPRKTGSDDPGMGWYYEPESDGNDDDTDTKPAVDNSAQRKQQELSMINAFLKSGQKAKPGSQIHSLMKRHGVSERVRDPEDWDEGNTEPGNNFAVYINGKKWKVLPGPYGAYADSPEERREFERLQAMAQRKSRETGKKWEVYVTGEPATK